MAIRPTHASGLFPSWLGRLLFALVLGLVLLCPSRKAAAQQWEVACTASASGSISIPAATVTNPSVSAGTLLGSPGTATVTFSCPDSGTGNPWQYFHLNSVSGTVTAIYPSYCYWGNRCSNYSSKTIQGVFAGTTQPVAEYGGLVYATSLSGVGILLTNPSPQLTASGGSVTTIAYPTTGTTVTFTAQLIATGAVIHAGTVSALGQVLTFENYWPGYTNSSPTYGSLTIAATSVVISACNLNTDSQDFTVILPAVTTSSLATTGATTGKTAFPINLTCAAGSNASITFSTASNYGSASLGVIKGTAGTNYAANVGVQLLQSNGTTPVPFGTAISEGTTPSGTMTLPFYAQYYATGTAGAGLVSATATFTVNYQ
jgi:type 1 fimbria pilin